MRWKNLIFVLTLAFLVAACSPQQQPAPGPMQGPMHDDKMPGMHGMMINSEEEFVVEMIPHHQEAVDTSLVIRDSTDNEELRDLADRIITAQREEIDMMRGWLDQYYDGGHEPEYEEMMPDLYSLEGEARDKAYIEGMIMHHMMAVMMARQVLNLDPSPHVEEFAQNVIDAQTSEIQEMQQMLRSYGGTTMANNQHMGCAPAEISESGTCKPADFRNADMFHVDNLEDKIISEEIIEEDFRGYLARPAEEGTYPAVVMIHEWWGLNQGIKYMADVLASEGYVVFAIDLYDGEVAETSSKAGELSGQVRNNLDESVDEMVAATQWLKSRDDVDEDNVASLGWCFGGGMSLQLALSGEPLAGTVIYYGTLTSDKTELETIDWPVLGIFAGEDERIDAEMVGGFNQSLTELGKEKDIYIYEGVDHAFANPSGERFAPEETRDAWSKTLAFLEENLKTNNPSRII